MALDLLAPNSRVQRKRYRKENENVRGAQVFVESKSCLHTMLDIRDTLYFNILPTAFPLTPLPVCYTQRQEVQDHIVRWSNF